jgi:hypothetical protein
MTGQQGAGHSTWAWPWRRRGHFGFRSVIGIFDFAAWIETFPLKGLERRYGK